MDMPQRVCVRNLRPQILRGAVGDTEYEILVGESAEVDSRLASFWVKQHDAEILRETKDAKPVLDALPEDIDQEPLLSAGSGERKKFSGFHGR